MYEELAGFDGQPPVYVYSGPRGESQLLEQNGAAPEGPVPTPSLREADWWKGGKWNDWSNDRPKD